MKKLDPMTPLFLVEAELQEVARLTGDERMFQAVCRLSESITYNLAHIADLQSGWVQFLKRCFADTESKGLTVPDDLLSLVAESEKALIKIRTIIAQRRGLS